MAGLPPGFRLDQPSNDATALPAGFAFEPARQQQAPWAKPSAGTYGNGVAVFPDEPTPFQGLKPDIESGYLKLAQDPRSSAGDLVAYAKNNGFSIDPKDADAFIAKRSAGGRVGSAVRYSTPPRLLTDPGDGAVGAFGRGLGDPINMLDEAGGLVDTLGGTNGRESVWNSNRRFGDILYSNIDKNRSILGYDDANHGWARFGGQVASGFVLPGASIEGVGLAAGRKALSEGLSVTAARDIARRAVRKRLLMTGAAEGAVAGYGAGEGGVANRLPGAGVGAMVGAVAAPAIGELGGVVGTGIRNGRKLLRSRFSKADDLATDVAESSAHAEVDNVANGAPTPPGFVLDAAPADLAMRADMASGIRPASIEADLPAGFTLDGPVGRPSPIGERASPGAIAEIANGTDPRTLLPIPRSEVSTLEQADRISAGRYEPVRAPDERQALPSYTINNMRRRDPLDLIGWLRTQGGIREDRGELARMGIDNQPRDLEFAKSERFLGGLVRPEGMSLDEAAARAWDAGYFPDQAERPDINSFLDALQATHRGGSGRVFHPDDYDAIDTFRAAQAQRYSVEQAQAKGRPFFEDRSQPVTMAGLDDNRPPVTAYEDLPSLGGKVGNIRVDKLESSADITRALQTVDNRFGGFDAARRGRITQAETEALASEMGMTADDLLRRRRGQALNAEQALAARSILAKSGGELVNLARAAQGGADDAVAAFRAGLVRHAAIQEQVAGATAEAGRALAQFRMTAHGPLAKGRILKSIIESGGGREKIEDVAQKLLDLEKEGPDKLNSFVAKTTKPRFWDMAKEYWINALLSGPRTHATNIGSNALTALWSVPEHAATAAIGKLTRSADAMTFRDVGARAVGMMEGARDGLRLARKAFVTGMPTDGAAQVEAQNYRAIPGLAGEVIRIPTRALMAEDEFFKSIHYRGEINALAAREAYRRGRSVDDRGRIFAELRDNPTDSMIDQAVKAAQYQTFQAPLKGPGVQIQMLANKGPMKLFLPFVRTPLNLLKYATERSPLAPVLSEFRDAMRAGGRTRDQAMARVAMGSGLSALAVSWALDGKLSGSGPSDPREREALRNTGWQPFSIKVGDRWYSYQRVDPFARVLSTAADFATFGDYMTEEQRENMAQAMSLAVARNVSTMPTLDPAASAFEALSDPDRYLQRYVTNLTASAVVPNVVTQINSTIDPYMRETDGILDTVKSRVPGLSQDLPARVNMWGSPIERGDALGPDLLSPIYSSRTSDDRTLNEIARLRVGISKPDRSIGGVRLTPGQYQGFVTGAGVPAKAQLDELTASPAWGRLPDGLKRVITRNVVSKARSKARAGLLMSNPDLLQAEMLGRLKRKTGER